MRPVAAPFVVRPTRRSQPYRRNDELRQPGPALHAMLAGRPTFLPNPMDAERDLARQIRAQRPPRRAGAGPGRPTGSAPMPRRRSTLVRLLRT